MIVYYLSGILAKSFLGFGLLDVRILLFGGMSMENFDMYNVGFTMIRDSVRIRVWCFSELNVIWERLGKRKAWFVRARAVTNCKRPSTEIVSLEG